MYNFKPEVAEHLKKLLDDGVKAYQKLYSYSTRADAKSLEQLPECELSLYRRRVTDNTQDILSLINVLQMCIEDYKLMETESMKHADLAGMGLMIYGAGISNMMGHFGTGVDYQNSRSYRFHKMGKSFSKDYSDGMNFLYHTPTGTSAFNKYNLASWGDTMKLSLDQLLQSTANINLGIIDEFTLGQIDGTLMGILSELPDYQNLATKRECFTYNGALKELAELTGLPLEEVKEIMSAISKLLDRKIRGQIAELGKTSGKINIEKLMASDKEIQKLLKKIPKKERAMFEKLLTDSLNSKKVLDKLGEADEIMTAIDETVQFAVMMTTDYSNQVSYLETIRNMMLQGGCDPHGAVLKRIEAIEQQYGDKCVLFAASLLKKAGELGEGAVMEAISAAIESRGIPVIGDVMLAQEVIGGVSGAVFSTEVSGVQALTGTLLYDEALTRSYEEYVQMIDQGIATEADVAEADRIFEVLYATKVHEYKTMCEMCKKDLFEYSIELNAKGVPIIGDKIDANAREVAENYKYYQEKLSQLQKERDLVLGGKEMS